MTTTTTPPANNNDFPEGTSSEDLTDFVATATMQGLNPDLFLAELALAGVITESAAIEARA